MTAQSTLTDITTAADRIAKTQKQLSSGRVLTKPSDDPAAVGQALRLRADLAAVVQYRRNTDDATAWLDVADGALASMGDVVQRARELVLQVSNDTVAQEARSAAARELEQLVDGVKAAANTQYAGRYVFAGTETLTAPYAAGASDAYAGNATALVREIGPGVQVEVSAIGSSVVGDGSSGLLQALRGAITALESGDAAALRTTVLQSLDAGQQAVLDARTSVGARTQRVELAANRLAQLEEVSTGLLSNVEDADMAETLLHFNTQQAVYQAALKAGSQMLQPSLMDYLRL